MAEDLVGKIKKQSTAILRARVKANKYANDAEKEAIFEVLKLRGVDVESLEVKGSEAVDKNAEEAYDLICSENHPKKVKLLAEVVEGKDFEDLSREEREEIIRISKLDFPAPAPKAVTTPSKKEATESVPFTEQQLEISKDESITKSERSRRLYDLGCSVKQIARNTGWDYTNIYDCIKAYEKKKEKEKQA